MNSSRDFVLAIRLSDNNFILGVKGGVVKRMGDVEREKGGVVFQNGKDVHWVETKFLVSEPEAAY